MTMVDHRRNSYGGRQQTSITHCEASRALQARINNINKGQIRSLGGWNVLLSGDVWQFPPLEGGLLGKVPDEYIQCAREFHPTPSIAQGKSLMWSGPATGMQGVAKLHVYERTRDACRRSVQEEVSHGCLSKELLRLLGAAS